MLGMVCRSHALHAQFEGPARCIAIPARLDAHERWVSTGTVRADIRELLSDTPPCAAFQPVTSLDDVQSANTKASSANKAASGDFTGRESPLPYRSGILGDADHISHRIISNTNA